VSEVMVPRLAESISDATLVEWLKGDGEVVRQDEPIATLETDKAAVEIAASSPGVLHHARSVGDRVVVGDVLARIDAAPAGSGSAAPAPAARTAAPAAAAPAPAGSGAGRPAAAVKPPPAPVPEVGPAAAGPGAHGGLAGGGAGGPRGATRWAEEGGSMIAPPAVAAPPLAPLSPAVRRLVEEHALDAATITPTGPGGRLLKEDVLRHLDAQPPSPQETKPVAREREVAAAAVHDGAPAATPAGAGERVVPMSRLRQRIAERLVQAQRTAAILTTFNELDMSAVMRLRSEWGETFAKTHGVKLGYMSLFARAAVLALADIPELNAEIRGTDLVYHEPVHLGVAVGTERGLVVPVVREAQSLDLAGLEREILRLAQRARDHRLSLEELAGGTFTLSNGGVYGSLLSTPILNPPQSGIFGMHKIEKRPIAVEERVEVRPMMYIALSYDHRIVDGEQAVTFLVRVKERLEHPERMLLGV
jgi:2-oxoglutarate dehydrogenase E2 component (dihydrolipoamide succinyltransferase)